MPSSADDARALDQIADILNRRYWNAPDVVFTIADLVRGTGRQVNKGEMD
jgi:hypothetical protein